MSEKKYRFVRYAPTATSPELHKQYYEKTESELTDAEKDHHLGHLISVWENTCGWAQNMFLHSLNNSIGEKHKKDVSVSDLLKEIENVIPKNEQP